MKGSASPWKRSSKLYLDKQMQSSIPLEPLLAAALRATARAFPEILSVYGGSFTVDVKEDLSPVTEADRAIVLYNWFEGGKPKSHIEEIPAGTREKTSTCDSTGTSSASSTDCRYPLRPSKLRHCRLNRRQI